MEEWDYHLTVSSIQPLANGLKKCGRGVLLQRVSHDPIFRKNENRIFRR